MESYVLSCVLLLGLQMINEAHAGVTREQMEKMSDGFRKTCVGKTGADLTLVEGIRDGKFVEDPASKCYTKCIMALMKTVTKAGNIDVEMAVKQIGIMASSDVADTMIAAARKCHAESSGDDPCNLAWNFTKCLYVTDPSNYFFP